MDTYLKTPSKSTFFDHKIIMARMFHEPSFLIARFWINQKNWDSNDLKLIWQAMLANKRKGKPHLFEEIIKEVQGSPARILAIQTFSDVDNRTSHHDLNYQITGAGLL
jgi:hypothetical protein